MDTERFWARVTRTDECWEWTGAHNERGYSTVMDGRRCLKAHRVAYELTIGPIPAGLELDHLCRNRGCVRPTHLEPVSTRENLLRGATIPAQYAARTHCPAGHPYTPDNTYSRPDGGRRCRTCKRESRRSAGV